MIRQAEDAERAEEELRYGLPTGSFDDQVARGSEEPAGGWTLDLLDVTEALGNHFHEHHSEIVRWPWKVFCAKWARMLRQTAQRMVRERAEKDKQAQEDDKRRLAQMHAEAWGS